MYVWLYCEINIVSMALLAVMAFSVEHFGFKSSSQNRAFVASILAAFCMNFFEIFWKLGIERTLKIPLPLIQVINALYFLSLGSVFFWWFIFNVFIFYAKMPARKWVRSLLLIPFLALVVLFVCNAFTGCLYTFNDEWEQIRGPLYYLQAGLAVSFFIPAVLLYVVHGKKFHVKQEEDAIFLSFTVPMVVAMLLQTLVQTLPILSVAPTLAFLLTYAHVLKLQVTMDPLTGISNRRIILKTLMFKCKNLKKGSRLFFLFLDIDNFKSLNDAYGHGEGDRALLTVADSLSTVCAATGGVCGRYGGDEFVVIQTLNQQGDIQSVCEKIEKTIFQRSQSEKYPCPIQVSIGYAEFNKDAFTPQELIDFSDEQMYKAKAQKDKVSSSTTVGGGGKKEKVKVNIKNLKLTSKK